MRVPISLILLCFAAAVAAPGEPRTWGETEFRGRTLRYEVRGGLAIHGGDMVLGRAEEIEARGSRRRGKANREAQPLLPRAVSAVEPDYLWPGGVIPYEIDPQLTERQREGIPEAIAAWNAQTVISLVPRDGQEDYVRFEATDEDTCAADVGRLGGRQGVYIGPVGCDKYALMHEIGHAVGLWHEHQREDRDEYLMFFEDRLGIGWLGLYTATHPAGRGAYDYASIMHYGLYAEEVLMETIPPGINDQRSYGLSAGDIDGVARLYGQPLSEATLSTFPPGLDLIVDGERIATPAAFDWQEGSEHIVEAPLTQAWDGEARYLFGRWNVDGGRRMTVKAGERTWIEANYVVQPKIETAVWTPGGGTVVVEPPSPDGYHLIRSTVTATALPAVGYDFLRWASWIGYAGESSNPARVELGWGAWTIFGAEFTTEPLFRIESRIDPLYLEVGGQLSSAPLSLSAPLPGEVGEVAVSIDNEQVGGAGFVRFEGWSDGSADAERTLEVPHEGGSIEVLASEWVRLEVGPPDGLFMGTATVEPSSPDGYYKLGTKVRVTPAPEPGYRFQRWEGDIQSGESPLEVEMDRTVRLEVHFERILGDRLLTPGVRQSTNWRGGGYAPVFYQGNDGFLVRPPRGAARLEIAFDCDTPGAEVDLYVNAGQDWPHIQIWAADGRSWELKADFRSENTGCSERIAIDAASEPPLDPGGVYGVAFVSRKTDMAIRGGVLATVEMAPKAPEPVATPRAFTFVAAGRDPAPQSFELSNDGDADLLWRAESDQAWLSAAPASGLLAPGETVEVSVTAVAGGLPSEAHAGRLAVRHDGVEDLELPVHFVVLPPDPAIPE